MRLRIFAVGGRLNRTARRLRLRVVASRPWATQIIAAGTQLNTLTPS